MVVTVERDRLGAMAPLATIPAPPQQAPGRWSRTRWLRWGVRPLLASSDLLAAILAVDLSGVRVWEGAVFAVVLLLLSTALGLDRSRLTLSVLDDLPRIIAVVVVSGAALLVVDGLRSEPSSRHAVLAASLALVFMLALRSLAYGAVRSVRRRGLVQHLTLVLGAGEIGGQIVSLLLDKPEHGMRPIGFLDADPLLDGSRLPVPVLGTYDDLADFIAEYGVADVILAFGSERESRVIDVLRTCDRMQCEIFVVPRLFEMHSGHGVAMDSVWGLPLVRMRRAAFRSPLWRFKRIFDLAVAIPMLALFSPLFAAIAIAVRIELGPGVLFRQSRVGVDGRLFELLKFRTLIPATSTESAQLWSIAHDARVGPVGRLLRRSSLDELPQLWNVLTGDMTLVGPRPERPYFAAEFGEALPRYLHRQRVPAGMTGWAQVHGLRGDTSMEHRVQFDNYYVENWSLWLDIKILLRTISSLSRGAR